MDTFLDPVFAVTASVAVAAALAAVTRRNPVYSAVWVLVSFLAFAVILLQLSAPFIAAMHVLVYTGAILVLFVFVIMLLNLKDDELGEEYGPRAWAAAAVGAVGLFGVLAYPVLADPTLAGGSLPVAPDTFGSIETVGRALFTQYGFAFELVSLLIIVATFGAMLLSKKRLWT